MKAVDTKWTKHELEGYMQCCVDQLRIMAKKYAMLKFYTDSLLAECEYYYFNILQHSKARKILKDALRWYKKAVIMNTLLKAGVYKDGED